jgi:hypothetical protein
MPSSSANSGWRLLIGSVVFLACPTIWIVLVSFMRDDFSRFQAVQAFLERCTLLDGTHDGRLKVFLNVIANLSSYRIASFFTLHAAY